MDPRSGVVNRREQLRRVEVALSGDAPIAVQRPNVKVGVRDLVGA